MTFPILRCPFPYFGGKSRVADVVWRAFGADCPNYVEPFAGSLAVLLGRPGGGGHIETVNDRDRYLANFWRAVAADPEAVARHADWPVNEADLHARHSWLVNQVEFRERMHTDPDFYDAKVAGWWVWGICQWIGSGWCRERETRQRKRPYMNGNDAGMGVHSTMARQRPFMGGDHAGLGVHRIAPSGDWFLNLQHRLRRVRVACGDWTRVLGPSVLKGKALGGCKACGVFLDPPYAFDVRHPELYSQDDLSVGAQARQWALEHGEDPALRIALCGYSGEHDMPASWRCHAWRAIGGYGTLHNCNLERIWFSPHCLPVDVQLKLFSEVGT
jgi:DNA adenine methylase